MGLVVADALENELGAGIEAVGLADVVGAPVEARGARADADQAIRRHAAVAPGSARLTGCAVHAFGGRHFEGPTGAPAADFGYVGTLGVDGGDAEEAVATEVHQAATVAQIRTHTGEHVGGPILVVRAGEDDAVGRQQVGAFGVQVVIGDDVDLVAGGFQPVDEIEVSGESGGGRPDAVAELGPHVEDGPQVGDVGGARSVGVAFVEAGQAVGADEGELRLV